MAQPHAEIANHCGCCRQPMRMRLANADRCRQTAQRLLGFCCLQQSASLLWCLWCLDAWLINVHPLRIQIGCLQLQLLLIWISQASSHREDW